MTLLLRAVHLAIVLGAAVVVGTVGRHAARRARQPAVIGEITAGLLAGPALLRLVGPRRFHELLPAHTLVDLKLVVEAGLVLFMVGLAHELRLGPVRPTARTTGWVAAGSFLPALAAGALLAGWMVLTGDSNVRGSASGPSFVLMIAISLSITAVPVLARILTDHGMTETEAGRIALSASVVIDSVSWLVLAVAVGLRTGRADGVLRSFAALAVGLVVAWSLRRLLSTRVADRLCERSPAGTAVVLGAVAIAMGGAMEEAGMTAIFGAVLVGLAVPARRTAVWTAPVASVTRVGRVILPIFFVAGGVTVLTGSLGSVSWTFIAMTTVLGIVAKVAGGYLGARFGKQGRWASLRIGSLMNTRGLTELIVLQTGLSAGILTPPVFLAFVVMALTTTALTGPLLQFIDRAEMRRPPAYRSACADDGAT